MCLLALFARRERLWWRAVCTIRSGSKLLDEKMRSKEWARKGMNV
jgi:hypothetical protein